MKKKKTITVNPAITGKQMQRLDRMAIDEIGIPSIVLMENAGHAVADTVLRILNKKSSQAYVCVMCGLGNNAGDGFVAARLLRERGIRVKVFLIGKAENLKQDALLNYNILRKLKQPVKEVVYSFSQVKKDFFSADVIVDAIFGVGLNREIGDPFKGFINLINQSKRKVVSVDMPSGLDATTGCIYGNCVRATHTVTLGLPKIGLFKKEGPRHSGKITVADIGIPQQLVKRIRRS